MISYLITSSLIAQDINQTNVQIRNTIVHTIESKIVDSTVYEIHITLPSDYTKSEKSYPVLYYLDAYHWGGTVIESYRLLRAFNEIKPIILVGISYSNATPAEEAYYRYRDLLPTVITETNTGSYTDVAPSASGGATDFIKFIKDELKPMIKTNYRAQEIDSGILGISNGALFVTWAMFNDPNEFDNYVIGSPRFDRDNFVILEFEEEYYNKNKSLPANVFLSMGSEDFEYIILSWIKLRDRLRSRNYKDLNLIVTTFEGENHTSGIPATISRGIRELYKNR